MNGIVIVDKPKGYTSRDIVNIVGSILDTKKIGHAGTLDPIATGVLVLAVGNGLKILEFINERDKEYIATVKMGISTDTLDISGNVLTRIENYYVDLEKINKALNSFKGRYEQTVPLYSSVKVGGQRLYKYARENKSVELPKRMVEIYDIELLSSNHDEFTFRTVVSKGTYIRSLIRDIGEKIDIPCTMKELRRTRQGDFPIECANTMEEIESGNISFVSLEKTLNELKIVEVDDYLEKRISNGSILENRYDEDKIAFKNKDNEIIAIYEVYEKDKNKIKPVKVFNK